jgi:hypothetical protein
MENDFLANLPKEGSDPFADLETDTPTGSPADTKPESNEEDKPETGDNTAHDNLPFHKHPRWIERENELKELREREELRASEIAELKAFKEEAAKKLEPATTQIPEWFRELYGENTAAWNKYVEHEASREKEIEQRVIERQKQEAEKQQADIQKWNKWVDSEVSKLEAEGHTFDKNKLIKTMLEYRPTDENNNFDFKAGFRIYQAMEGKDDSHAASQAKKVLADTVTKVTRGEKPAKDYLTAHELRRKSWGSL